MQTTDKQAQAAIKSDNEAQATPLNLHAMYRQQASCDFTRSLLLVPHTVGKHRRPPAWYFCHWRSADSGHR